MCWLIPDTLGGKHNRQNSAPTAPNGERAKVRLQWTCGTNMRENNMTLLGVPLKITFCHVELAERLLLQSNCHFLQACFIKLGLYVSQWNKTVSSVIAVISDNSLPPVFAPTSLPPVLAIFMCLISQLELSSFLRFSLYIIHLSLLSCSVFNSCFCVALIWNTALITIPTQIRDRSSNPFVWVCISECVQIVSSRTKKHYNSDSSKTFQENMCM